MLVVVTLAGALPVYRRVAEESPHGEGSIAMLERLLSFWKGKLFVLTLLGFAATDFLITITLSAADASTHLVENPHLTAALHDQQMVITLVLVALLGAVFLKGFLEADRRRRGPGGGLPRPERGRRGRRPVARAHRGPCGHRLVAVP